VGSELDRGVTISTAPWNATPCRRWSSRPGLHHLGSLLSSRFADHTKPDSIRNTRVLLRLVEAVSVRPSIRESVRPSDYPSLHASIPSIHQRTHPSFSSLSASLPPSIPSRFNFLAYLHFFKLLESPNRSLSIIYGKYSEGLVSADFKRVGPVIKRSLVRNSDWTVTILSFEPHYHQVVRWCQYNVTSRP
jgi:hypothetical protein